RAAAEALAEPQPVPAPPSPPDQRATPGEWVRANLFPSPANGALTLALAAVACWGLYRLGRWTFVTAEWTVVRVNLRLFMVGRFPADQLWRPWASAFVLAAVAGLAAGAAGRAATGDGPVDPRAAEAARADRRPLSLARRFWPLILATVVVLSFTRTPLPALASVALVAVLAGAVTVGRRLPAGARRWTTVLLVAGIVAAVQVVTWGPGGVGWDDWGGLFLTVTATVAGIALAFPLGLVLALGRRSSLPGIHVLATAYIEAFRAVPLVTLLFVGQYMIGFLFPTSVDPPSFLVRSVIAITVFEAAYIAEIVRGGLQAVPPGQVEAAQALGLSTTGVLRLVVLPQALRAVIPAMVGQFISLFKDTSLLSIVGFFELMTVAEAAAIQDRFRGRGLQVVALAFVGLLYWAGCSTMARESRRLERRLGVGER
ncbi:MAG TPA: amino acid ABC transporter permease, partial [Acidimicrobiales bacterium]|nr:amino acid ABC transporter permease [Acidimicrobiales bacterium]